MSNKNNRKGKKITQNEASKKIKKTKTNNPKRNMQQTKSKTAQPNQQKTDNQKNLEFLKQNSQLEARIVSLEQEIQDWKNKSLRLAADLQNIQKQQELDISQTKKKIKKNTIDSIFSFLNTLQISFNYLPQTDDEKVNSFLKTLEVSYNQVLDQLKQQNIEIINVKPGDSFNPEFMTILSESGDGNTTVKQVVSIGLKIDDQIIQPASVML